MKLKFYLALGAMVAAAAPAYGQSCTSFPYTNASGQIVNGSTANASQVWGDFQYIGGCAAPLNNPSFTGNVGIGTATPLAVLHVAGDDNIGVPSSGLAAANFSQFFVTGSTNTSQRIMIGYDTTNDYGVIAAVNISASAWKDLELQPNNSTGVPTVTIKASGNVGIGTTSPAQPLQVVGTIRQSGCTTAGTLSTNTSGDIICTSDARLKNILGDYRDGLSALGRISPQRFTYKTTPKDPVETFVHAGFIAQNVMTAIPEAVARQRDGYYSLDATAVLAASVNAIKELKAENDRLRAQVERQAAAGDEMKRDDAAMRAELHELERRFTALNARAETFKSRHATMRRTALSAGPESRAP